MIDVLNNWPTRPPNRVCPVMAVPPGSVAAPITSTAATALEIAPPEKPTSPPTLLAWCAAVTVPVAHTLLIEQPLGHTPASAPVPLAALMLTFSRPTLSMSPAAPSLPNRPVRSGLVSALRSMNRFETVWLLPLKAVLYESAVPPIGTQPDPVL